MGSEWKKTSVGDVLEKDGGDIQTGPFGTKLKAAEYTEEGVPVISVGEVRFGNLVVHDKTPRVPPAVTERMPEYLLLEGDIVFGRKGAVERSGLVTSEQEGWFLGSDGIRIRLPSCCDARFVSYQFLTRAHKIWMVQHAAGTTMASLNESIVKRIPLILPSLSTQKAIAHILGTLDDKIELNRRMNETLESMARAMFKSWFVDFDPVIDNALAAGNPIPEPLQARAETRRALDSQRKPLPDNIQNLFPNAFVFDEATGWIPEAWEPGVFGDVADHIRDNVAAEELPERELYIGLEHIGRKELFLSEGGATDSITSNKSAFRRNDLLFGKLRPYFHKVCIAPHAGVCSTDILVFRPRRESFGSFMIMTAYTDEFVEDANMRSTGTRMPRASAKDMLKYAIAVPSESILDSFDELTNSIWQKGMESVSHSASLTKLRDTLLPKLLSGELRIPDAEKLVGDNL
ncbi:restriction endonuclease subunit S [Rosistilla oblonga]|uniref:restriction endonuclease subunit S n=1 Tax=Rosistilla oblonga TaxID=2527990 RepID=UPI003A983842